jgi:tetratricopeptide (TPR) repeat protein
MGNIKYLQLDYNGAILDYNKAIELNPKLAGAYNDRGLMKWYLKDYRGAIMDYDKAIELISNSADVYCNRGLAKHDIKDYKGAMTDFNKALEIDPLFYKAYHNRGRLKDKLNDYQGAIVDYNKAIEINPKLAEAYSNRGVVKQKLQDDQGAILDYNLAIEINPTLIESYYNRGLTKHNLQNYREAIADFDKAIELSPKNAEFYSSRGDTKTKLKDYQGAITDYNRALEINPNQTTSPEEYLDFTNGITKTFICDGNGKAHGLKFSIKHPRNWFPEEARGESIVKKIMPKYSGGLQFGSLVQVFDNETPISKSDSIFLLSKEGVVKTLGIANLTKYSTTNINGKKVVVVQYTIEVTQSGINLFYQQMSYVIVHKRHLVIVNFSIGSPSEFKALVPTAFNRYAPFFNLMVNSLKFL